MGAHREDGSQKRGWQEGASVPPGCFPTLSWACGARWGHSFRRLSSQCEVGCELTKADKVERP